MKVYVRVLSLWATVHSLTVNTWVVLLWLLWPPSQSMTQVKAPISAHSGSAYTFDFKSRTFYNTSGALCQSYWPLHCTL